MAMDEYEARAVLGVSDSAAFGEIRKSYRTLVKALHPDLAPKDSRSQVGATSAMTRVNEAWECINALELKGTLGQKAPKPSGSSSTFRVNRRTRSSDECEMCGSWPAIPVKLYSIATFAIYRGVWKYDGTLCRSCGLAMSRYALRQSMLRGWWGVGAIFMPKAIFRAISAERKLNKLGDPLYRDVLVISPQEIPMQVGKHPTKQPLPVMATLLFVALLILISQPSEGTGGGEVSKVIRYSVGSCLASSETADGTKVVPVDCSSTVADKVSLGIVTAVDLCPIGTLYTVNLEQGSIACLRDR